MIILPLIFFSSLMSAANTSLVGFSIAPNQYVDCPKWLDEAAKRPDEFPSYEVGIDDINPLAKLLTVGMGDAAIWPTALEPNYISQLKECAIYKKSETDFYLKKKPEYTLFVCFLAGVQLYKLITCFQIEAARRLAQNNQVDETFSEIKKNDFVRVSDSQFHSKVVTGGKRFFGTKLSENLLAAIKRCDSCLSDTPSSIEYEAILLGAFRDCLLGINDVLLKHSSTFKSKL